MHVIGNLSEMIRAEGQRPSRTRYTLKQGRRL